MGDIVDVLLFDCLFVDYLDIDVVVYCVVCIVVLELVVDLFGYYDINVGKMIVLL